MRLSRRYLIAAAVAAVAAAGIALPAEAAAGKYVALGDSYSSGLGAGSYVNENCKISSNAYPQLWANEHDPSVFQFAACAGAVTSDVVANQVSALSPDTELVTISIGGNDAGFADVMRECILWSDEDCASRNQEAQIFAQQELPGRLDQVYAEIRNRAPAARVIVMGYPDIYHPNGNCTSGLSETKRSAINSSADVLAAVISHHAAMAGFEFVDARTVFDGHEICDPNNDWWLNGVTAPTDESFHPNVAGQSGYYAALKVLTG
jgi:lysophospholipase L1-like esterase